MDCFEVIADAIEHALHIYPIDLLAEQLQSGLLGHNHHITETLNRRESRFLRSINISNSPKRYKVLFDIKTRPRS